MKPENIIIGKDDRVKILDFGLAKLKGARKLTKNDSTLGTIHYMSPEQVRGGELRNLKWSDIHDNYLEFHGKTGLHRFPLNDDVKGILNTIKYFSKKPLNEYILTDYRTGRWLGAHSQLGKIVKKYIRKAKLDDRYTTHSLRHTFASHLVLSGTDIYTVSKLLGHTYISMTQKYSHLPPEIIKTRVKY